MRKTSMALALCALLVAGACSNDQSKATAQNSGDEPVAVTKADLTPEQLGELGAEIRKNPNEAQQALEKRGLDEKTFEQAVRKVSEDPEASRRYAESYKKASA